MKEDRRGPFTIHIAPDDKTMGEHSGEATTLILEYYTVGRKKPIALNAAVAPSQTASYDYITQPKQVKRVNWNLVHLFHMDDYPSLPRGHPNTFEVGLKQELVDKLPIPEKNVTTIKQVQKELARNGISEASALANEYGSRVGAIIKTVRSKGGIYVVHSGIGENGHMAFNDPHIDKWNTALFHVVEIDEACRRQQLHDYQNHPNQAARYKNIEDVPKSAISATMALLFDADETICVVPGIQKADAVKKAIEGPLDDRVAASFARLAGNFSLYLTKESASKLTERPMPDYKG